ncbi:MAG: hypothetical protein SGI83_00170 [Bacteroidota bacterium]|nr:hypothetical protein [Bacteroidota bacterium]
MISIISKKLALVIICSSLFSFSPVPGGEGFEIYLNNKVVLQQYGSDMNTIRTLQLVATKPADQLMIKYHHCGEVGKNRIVTIKDAQNSIMKEFRFPDGAIPVAAMSVPVKDIVKLKKGNIALKLYYTSSELPAGRMLALINTAAGVQTQP